MRGEIWVQCIWTKNNNQLKIRRDWSQLQTVHMFAIKCDFSTQCLPLLWKNPSRWFTDTSPARYNMARLSSGLREMITWWTESEQGNSKKFLTDIRFHTRKRTLRNHKTRNSFLWPSKCILGTPNSQIFILELSTSVVLMISKVLSLLKEK